MKFKGLRAKARSNCYKNFNKDINT